MMAHKEQPAKPSSRKVRRVPILRKKLAGCTLTLQRCRSGPHTCRVVVNLGGKRTTKAFETVEAAKQYFQKQEIEAGNAGARAAKEITDNVRRIVLQATDSLAAHGKTLEDAVRHYLAHLEATSKSAATSVVIEELQKHKEAEKKAPKHLEDIRLRLRRFAESFGTRPLASITAEEINQWLVGLKVQPITTNNFRRSLALLFNFGAARGYCSAGLTKRILRLKVEETEPGILTIAEAGAILAGAPDEIRASIAIGLFAGLRTAELHRMDWRNVDFENEMIIVGGGMAKKMQRRTIPMRPNLRAWLEPLRQIGGKLIPAGYEAKKLMDEARAAGGFKTPTKDPATPEFESRPWPSNAMRHSYASYRLAMWPDAAALALEMGNSPAIILKHYRSLVKPAAAKAFWEITPETASGRTKVINPEIRTA